MIIESAKWKLKHLSRICGTVINLTSSKGYKWSTAVGLYKRTNEKVGSRWSQRRSAFSAFEAKGQTHILIASWTKKGQTKLTRRLQTWAKVSLINQNSCNATYLAVLRIPLKIPGSESWPGPAPKPNCLFLVGQPNTTCDFKYYVNDFLSYQQNSFDCPVLQC